MTDYVTAEKPGNNFKSGIWDTRYSTLKYYTEEGMLPFEQEEENLTRRYPREANIRRIQEIKELRKEGMTISEIKEVLCGNNQKTSGITG